MSESVHDEILDYYKTKPAFKISNEALMELLSNQIDEDKKLKAENEKLREALNILNEIAKDMYKKLPCDAEFSPDCTPCSYDDFLAHFGNELNGFSNTIVEKE